LSEITLTRYEKAAMFKVPPPSNDPLPACTRHPVIIEGDTVTLVEPNRPTVAVKVESIPKVDKAA
jgi:hypothetical protein